MAYTIHTCYEGRRGCGYRKEGGLYLVSGGLLEPCHRLPHPLTVCPTCHAGIKPARGWTWLDGNALFRPACEATGNRHCSRCPACRAEGLNPAGLLWVGEVFYPTLDAFTREAARLGISRRIHQIPRGFAVGHHYVLLAHRRALADKAAGIFTVFRPERIEYVVRPDDPPEKLERLHARGITLVRVVPDSYPKS